MTHTVEPIDGTLDADVRLPGSKSLTNRALVAAALADGTSQLHGIGLSDDTDAMMGVIEALGVDIELEGTTAIVHGRGGVLQHGAALDARQSGTTARFAAPMLVIAGGGSIDGHEQMRLRPMGELVAALRDLGAELDSGVLPLAVSVPGPLAEQVTIPATTSSQFVSALLLAAPALPNGLGLTLAGTPVSSPYIEMTISVMRSFGAAVERDGDFIQVAPTGYRSASMIIEPDASTATYPMAAAAIVGGRVRIVGLGRGSVQGDVGFGTVLERMGAAVYVEDDHIEVRGSGSLRAVDVDLGAMSDTAPTFGAVAARARGTSHATGIGFIRSTKESDRVAAIVTELERLGITARVDHDGFAVTGGSHHHSTVETYDDHRMAMALSLLGLVGEPVTITDPGCVAKTFPGFFDLLERFRATARTEPLVLAIDGPAGSGKSTVADAVARSLRLPHLDTGAMYRAVALVVERERLDLSDGAAVAAAARRSEIVVERSGVWLDGEDVSSAIRSPEVTELVSPVATIGDVRRHLVAQQRTWARAHGAAVVEGRDIGSAVFPDATLKVYLTASVEERARRRAFEVGSADLEDMRRRIRDRDEIDSKREHDPLTIADGAHVIDSSSLDIDGVTTAIVRLWTDEQDKQDEQQGLNERKEVGR